MTAIEQIEDISVKARELGMSYGKYVAKYGHTIEKPKEKARTGEKVRKKYKERQAYELTCGMCGDKFEAKSKVVRFCVECRKKRNIERCKEWYRRKKEEIKKEEGV